MNILTGDWVFVSPHRAERPWQGEVTADTTSPLPAYDPGCYLCPNNTRANGEKNPAYAHTFAFTNDYSALLPDTPNGKTRGKGLLVAQPERGMCRVLNFSPLHNKTLAEMEGSDLVEVVTAWQKEYRTLSSVPGIRYVLIFENKGFMMGNSNPHPHCQIWAQESIPMEPSKELRQFRKYFAKNKRGLLGAYLDVELHEKARIVFENRSFVVLVPFWAVWPYETMIISRRKIGNILQFSPREKEDFAGTLGTLTKKYDNLFRTSFPYSAGMHQSPTDGAAYPEWHFHMHFLPPLLRSASIRKYMVGYEMLAEPQRDITPEASASTLRALPEQRFSEERDAVVRDLEANE